MDILEIITLVKFVLGGIGGIGLIVFILGLINRKKEQIIRGAIIFGFAAIIGFCVYLVYTTAVERMYDRLDNTYINN